jgi:hypothetical protein
MRAASLPELVRIAEELMRSVGDESRSPNNGA